MSGGRGGGVNKGGEMRFEIKVNKMLAHGINL